MLTKNFQNLNSSRKNHYYISNDIEMRDIKITTDSNHGPVNELAYSSE